MYRVAAAELMKAANAAYEPMLINPRRICIVTESMTARNGTCVFVLTRAKKSDAGRPPVRGERVSAEVQQRVHDCMGCSRSLANAHAVLEQPAINPKCAMMTITSETAVMAFAPLTELVAW